jgi:KDO2-lipid IV(A) lauroyltransferase
LAQQHRPPVRPISPHGQTLALIAGLLTALVPRRAGYWLVDRLAELAYLALGRYRRAVLANVSQVLARPPSDPCVRAAARACFRTSGRNFWDLCCLPHTRRDWLVRQVDVEAESWRVLLDALRRGRGVIAATAHLGAFDYAGQMLTLLPTRPLSLTAQTTSADWLFQDVTRLRSSWGMLVEPVTPGALRRTIAHLRRGGVIGLVADRDINHTGRPVMICDRPTTLPVGPVRLALDTGAAVVLILCPRQGDRFSFICREVPIDRTGNLQHDLDHNLATLAIAIESALRTWPDQSVTFERLWPE